jgi:cysteine desulfurase / selenocysteine lyase
MLSEKSRRHSFPTLDQMVYLNTAAEGIPPLGVGAALERYFHDKQQGMDGRISHAAEWHAVKALTAELYGLSADEIGICSSSSEAYNLAAMALRLQPGDEIVINDLDFPAGATPWLQPSCPATVKLWCAREGALRVEDLIPLLSSKTRLVVVSLVSFFNGFMVSLPAIRATIDRHSAAMLAVDVTQALGRIPLELCAADLIVSSTHKWILSSHGGGLVGVPAHRAAEWTAPAGGWYNLQDPFGPDRFKRVDSKPGAASFSTGMPNYPAIYAIRAGLDYIKSVGIESIDAHTRPLVLACLEGLQQLPVHLITPPEPDAIAGILAFRHAAIDDLQRRLHTQNIHVMAQAGRMRIAIHGYNTMQDIETFLRTLKEALHYVASG